MHNLPHSNKHVDVFGLMLGCSRLIVRLTSTLWALLVTLVSDDMSSRVADVAQRIGSWLVSLGMVPWWGTATAADAAGADAAPTTLAVANRCRRRRRCKLI